MTAEVGHRKLCLARENGAKTGGEIIEICPAVLGLLLSLKMKNKMMAITQLNTLGHFS